MCFSMRTNCVLCIILSVIWCCFYFIAEYKIMYFYEAKISDSRLIHSECATFLYRNSTSNNGRFLWSEYKLFWRNVFDWAQLTMNLFRRKHISDKQRRILHIYYFKSQNFLQKFSYSPETSNQTIQITAGRKHLDEIWWNYCGKSRKIICFDRLQYRQCFKFGDDFDVYFG